MKLVKLLKFGTITTSIDGSLYILSEEAIAVDDSIASKLKDQFLDTIEVIESIVKETKVEPTKPIEKSEEKTSDSKKKVGKKITRK